MYLALLYDPAPSYLERRKAFREEHLALVRQYQQQGRILMAGAFNPPDGALLVFRVESAAEVEEFVKADPYVRNGVVTGHRIREWIVVVGG
jgi:uncharacterized protein YciI